MKTENLIDLLAKGVEPAQRTTWLRDVGVTLGIGLAAALLIVAVGIGVRPDIATAQMPVLMKATFSAAAAAVILPIAMRLATPGRPLGWRVGAVAVFTIAAAAVTVMALFGEPPERRMEAWMGGGFPWCLVLIPVLAAPTAALLAWLMRALAPTRLTMSGAAIGGLSGGVGAMAYSMYCPVDSVAFVTTWYVIAIALCAALGALIVSRFLRW